MLKTKHHRKRRERLLGLPTWRRIDSKKLSRKKGMDKIMEVFELKYRLKIFRISKMQITKGLARMSPLEDSLQVETSGENGAGGV